MALKDSVDKIVQSYFAAVTREPFYYKGKWYYPKTLRVSPLLFRGYTCPAKCGGCCTRFSLDYLPYEKQPEGVSRREVLFNEKPVEIFSDLQLNGDHFCQHLNRIDARCNIHEINPFSCDFELMRFLISGDDGRANQLTQKLYGRGWNFKRIDGERGALCEMIEPDEFSVKEVSRKLHRLSLWTHHFGLETTWIPELRIWADSGPHKDPLVLVPEEQEIV